MNEGREDSILVGWARSTVARERCLSFRRRGGEWETSSYPEIAKRVRVVAGQVIAATRGGHVVGILARSPFDIVVCFFGALYAGAVPAVLPTPRMFERSEPYARRVETMAAAGQIRTLIVADELSGPGTHLADVAGIRLLHLNDALTGEEVAEPLTCAHDAPAMLQFTSGSSGPQRGVLVTRQAVEANLEALHTWLVADPDTDVSLSWLPPHHDMGLVGLILLPVVNQAEARFLSAEEFVQNPLTWLQAISDHRATVGACPPFGLSHCVRALQRRSPPEFDLSSMRRLVVGAETITAGPLERFVELTQPMGFDAEAILPAYGMAEVTLGATGTRPATRPTKLKLRPDSVAIGGPVEWQGIGRLFDDSGEPDWLVGSGVPLPGVVVTVVDDDDRMCPEGVTGHIMLTSSSLAAGYVDEDGFSAPWPAGGPMHTGDAGFVLDGELFVLGREGDALKVRGRAVFAESVEARLGELVDGPRRTVVVMGPVSGRDSVLIVCEGAINAEWRRAALRAAKAEVQDTDIHIGIVSVPRKTIEYTSSGKPRRRPLWRRVAAGEIDLGGNAYVRPEER